MEAKRDENRVTGLLAVNDVTGELQAVKVNSSGEILVNLTGGAGGATKLNDLTDVTLTSPSDGQLMIFDNASSLWVNSSDLATAFTIGGSYIYRDGGTDVAVADGGTGASDAGTARTNLGLGTISTQASNNVSITGGAITGITDLTVADGGTGASNSAGARTNLGLVIGTDVQAYNGNLADISGITGTAGDIIYYNGANWVDLADGTNSQVLTTNGSGTLSWETPSSGFTDPMTTRGDLIYKNASNVTARLGVGTANQVLQSDGTDTAWASLDSSDVGLGNVENTALSTWVGTTNITTLGTIGAGVWTGTDIAVADGGTGASTDAGARTNLGLVIGTDVLAEQTIGIADDNLVEIDSATVADNDYAKFTANGLEGRSYAEVKTDLGLVIGTNVQAFDATLTSLALLGTGADKFAYTTGVDTWAEASITTAGRAILDDADASAQRTTLGLGTISTQDSDSVSITGGSITGITDLAIADGGTGAGTASDAFTALKQDATTGATGVVELTISTEVTTGTDTTRAITPDAFAGSDYGKRVIQVAVSDPNGDALTTGDGKAYFRIPSVMNGWNLVGVSAMVTTVSSSGTPTVQVYNLTQTADMLSTVLTIDASELDSSTATTPAVIDTANDDVTTADHIRLDVDVAGTDTKGLLVELIFNQS